MSQQPCYPNGTQWTYGPNGQPVPVPTAPATAAAAVAGLAGELALKKSGAAANDPFVANILMQRAQETQRTLDSVGLGGGVVPQQ